MIAIDQMREFIDVVDTGNFTMVAKRRYMSQPTLTKRIQRLEEALGTRLLDRRSKSFLPTDAGRLAYESFKCIVEEYDRLSHGIEALKRELSGHLTIAVLYYGIDELTTPYVERFCEDHPQVEVEYVSCQNYQARELLLSGKVDLAVLAVPRAMPDHRFAYTPVQAYRERFVVGQGSPLADRSVVRREDLSDLTCLYLSTEGLDAQGCIDLYHCHDAIDATQVDMLPHLLMKHASSFTVLDDIVGSHFPSKLSFIPFESPFTDLVYCYARRISDDNPLVAAFEKTVSELVR